LAHSATVGEGHCAIAHHADLERFCFGRNGAPRGLPACPIDKTSIILQLRRSSPDSSADRSRISSIRARKVLTAVAHDREILLGVVAERAVDFAQQHVG